MNKRVCFFLSFAVVAWGARPALSRAAAITSPTLEEQFYPPEAAEIDRKMTGIDDRLKSGSMSQAEKKTLKREKRELKKQRNEVWRKHRKMKRLEDSGLTRGRSSDTTGSEGK